MIPDRVSVNLNSPYYHPDHKNIFVYLNDIVVDRVVEANRRAGWVVKLETDDRNRPVYDPHGRTCMRMLYGKVEFRQRRYPYESPRNFFSDYDQGSDGPHARQQ